MEKVRAFFFSIKGEVEIQDKALMALRSAVSLDASLSTIVVELTSQPKPTPAIYFDLCYSGNVFLSFMLYRLNYRYRGQIGLFVDFDVVEADRVAVEGRMSLWLRPFDEAFYIRRGLCTCDNFGQMTGIYILPVENS